MSLIPKFPAPIWDEPPPEDPKWRIYEKAVADMAEEYPDCAVLRDHKIMGKSGVTRQVDAWVNGKVAGVDIKLAIECKCYTSKVGIKTIEAFAGFLDDVGANKGVLVSTSGSTKGGEARAKRADIRLDVIDLAEAEATDWSEYFGRGCQSWGDCWGSVNWDYSEGGTIFGFCSDCGEFHIYCDNCGHIATYGPDGGHSSICEVHVCCESCGQCFVIGMEKGDPCDISACKDHPTDPET